MPNEPFLSRTYSLEDQSGFASLSGDYNPIHVDPIAARRTLIGGAVVHGVHLTLTGVEAALESAARSGIVPLRSLASLRSDYLKPALVGDEVSFRWVSGPDSSDVWKIRLFHNETPLCRIELAFGEVKGEGLPESPLPAMSRHPLRDLSFEELEGKSGEVPIGIDAERARALFPRVFEWIGGEAFAEILGLTTLVGMHCPGLHSLFGSFQVALDRGAKTDLLRYEVKNTDERFQSLLIEVKGGKLEGKINAFRRPSPQKQPSFAEARRSVVPGEFSGTVSLIVGGSRGLGEVTAKILAAGGGFPVITYHQGRDDAERVAEEIREGGGRCGIAPFDVSDVEGALKELGGEPPIQSLYYFATPRISKRRKGLFDFTILEEFNRYYSVAFGRLVESLSSKLSLPLRVFYPSTIYAGEAPKELAEYGLAKRAGEDLCSFYNGMAARFRIVCERLPRVSTDQTASISPASLPDGLSVMLPLVRLTERAEGNFPSTPPAS